ncbi:putative glucose-6-phosphate 1-epimerase [Helianthus anomalus]
MLRSCYIYHWPVYYFANFGTLEQHGFARNRLWSLDDDPSPLTPSNNQSTADLLLKSTEEDLKTWPYRFELRLRITVGAGKLTMIPRVKNLDNKAFTFTLALRNYFSVSDVSEVCVEGLETLDYFDNLSKRVRYREHADTITFDGEVRHAVAELDQKLRGGKRTIVLRKEGMVDAVLWNPWDKKAKAILVLGDEDYKTMLCLDAAAVENLISLKPCEDWKGRQELSIVSSSYFSGQLDLSKVINGLN